MDERWRVFMRVRELHTQKALDEVTYERQVRERAQYAVQQAQARQLMFEHQASEAGVAVTRTQGESGFMAADVQTILDYASAGRWQALQAAVQVRRAQMQRDRAQTRVNEAMLKYRHEAARKEALESRWQAELRAVRRRRMDHEDESDADERGGCLRIRRASADDPNVGGDI